jgi:hypothetical protein
LTRLSVIEAVRLYANAQGCVVLKGNRFVSRDGTRSVRFSETKGNQVIVWDTGTDLGYVALSRERRPSGLHKPMDLGDKPRGAQVGPLEAQGERA